MRIVCGAMCVLLFASVLAGEEKGKAAGPAKDKDGFVSLFDGKTFTGWAGNLKGARIENGTIISEHGNQYLEKEYANFVLRFEFKLPAGGNNGIGLRMPMQGDAAYVGMEIQVLDTEHAMYKGIKPYQAHGSVYGVAPAKRGFLKPTGEWNSEEIVADGGHIKVTLNGHVITDVDLTKIDKPMDGHQHPGLHNAKGHISLLGHTGPVAFRNLSIKTLP
jgi:hypothetical protein